MAAYKALGGIEGAIGKRAEAILEAQPPAVRAALPLLFSRVVAAGSVDGAVRGLRSPWTQLSTPEERRLAAALVEERLFVSDISDREPVFGVAHEALLRQWPRAVAWIEEHRQALAARARLEAQAQQWLAEGRRADRLLRPGRPLGEARELLDHAVVPLGADIQALIRASIRQARRTERFRLGALAGFALIALAAIFLGVRAREAEKAAALRLAEAEDLMDYMLGDFAEKLRPLGRLDLLDGVAQKAMGYLTAEDAGRVPRTLRAQQAKALLTLAEVERARGHADPATRALTQADALLRASLAEGGDDRALFKSLGAIAFWFGQIALDQGRLDAAGRHFGEYRDFARRLSDLDPDDPDGWIELSYALSSVGMVQLRRGEEDGAAANFDASVTLKRRALGRRSTDQSLRAELANSLSLLANAEARRGRLEVAGGLYRQQRDLLDGLRREEPGAPVWLYRTALANQLSGLLLAALGRPEAASADLALAVGQIEECLRQDPSNRLWQRDRIIIRQQLARTTLALGHLDAVEAMLSGMRSDLDRAIAANPGDDILRQRMADYLMLRATLSHRTGMDIVAADAAAQAEVIARALPATGPQDKLKTILFANALITLAEIKFWSGAADIARNACREAADAVRSMAAASRDYRLLDPWVRASVCAGDGQAAIGGIEALKKMGYRDYDYVHFLTAMKG